MIGRLRSRRGLAASLAVLVVGALVVLAVLQFTRSREPTVVVIEWSGPISIDVPISVAAGEQFSAVITADAPDGTPAAAATFHAVDAFVYNGFVEDGRVEFPVDGTQTNHAGRIDVVVEVGRSQASASVLSIAQEPVDPVVPLVGPRTIIANGNDFTMVVATPIDRFGNPVPNGTEVVTEALRPDGTTDTIAIPVENGIAATILVSDTEVGRVSITSRSGDAAGPAHSVDQVAGIPGAFSVKVDGRNPVADGFALHTMSTSLLVDEFDNVLPDGVSATFVIDSPVGRSFVEATVQGGFAIGLLEAPRLPGKLEVAARVSGRESATTTLEFGQGVSALPLASTVDAGDLTITVGRVLATRGGYPPDGTMIELIDLTSGTVLTTGALKAGLGTLTVASDAASEELEVRVLGFDAPVIVSVD